MAARKCIWIHGTAGTPDYAAEDDRMLLAAVFGGHNFESISPGQGHIGWGHGVLSHGSMVVTASGTPNNVVTVAAGLATVRGTQQNDQGVYVCPLDAPEPLTVAAAHATLDRIDLVVAQVKDDEYTAFSADVWTVELVTGTPASSPVAPSAPEDALVLAEVRVRDATEASGTVVRPQDITDRRVQSRATGGVTPVANEAAAANLQEPFRFIWDIATSGLKMRNAANSAWLLIAEDPSVPWTSYTPTFAGAALGSPISRYGRYKKLGRTVIGEAGFVLGAGGTVNSELMCSLPVAAANPGFAASGGYMGGAQMFDNSAGVRYASVGRIRPDLDTNNIRAFATAGVSFWQSGIPVGWVVDDQFHCFFAYEAAS